MNAVNADTEYRYGMISTKLSLSGFKQRRLFLLAAIRNAISEFNFS